jgi:hypothetical protein
LQAKKLIGSQYETPVPIWVVLIIGCFYDKRVEVKIKMKGSKEGGKTR